MYHQHSHSQGHSGPPPAKRPKGNPVITKYPPPPGYRRPSCPPTWAPPVPQSYGFQSMYPTYGQPAYPPSQWPAFQQPVNPSVAYSQSTQSCPPHAGTLYPAYSLPWPAPGPTPPTGVPQWQHPPQQGLQNNKRRHSSSRPRSARGLSRTDALDGNGDPLSPPRHGAGTESYRDAIEHEFDDECYFARHPDEIQPSLSLGLIEWHSALPAKSALPPTFQEAELEALAPRKPRPATEQSISEYFTSDKVHETLLSVRQTEYWQDICDDVIYREFPVRAPQTLTLWELIEKYRDRPNPARSPQPVREPTPVLSRGPTPIHSEYNGDARSSASVHSVEQGEQTDILGDLEQALFPNRQATGSRLGSHSRSRSRAQSRNHSRPHSRAGSVCSSAGERITRPVPLAPVRDLNQENILAALGVTGSPKLVYQTPGPALGAPAPSSQHNRVNSVCSQRSDACHSRQASVETTAHVGQLDAIGSERHVKAYGELDLDATPRPKYDRVDSGRKRGYGEVDNDDDEATPQQNRFKVIKA